ncbi:polycomb group protein FIE2 [Iris pallida]|uniref:Polycomb group protein FIE2 n=1 Tax=Iris pallida TaxID=29817 RepID=A0AAX6GG86_IRIPA|nr:polycomb group protein FIE2 [Iris pallida]
MVFTASFHSNFVDYNRWLGDFILSKSVDSEIVPWEPKTMEQSPGRSILCLNMIYGSSNLRRGISLTCALSGLHLHPF